MILFLQLNLVKTNNLYNFVFQNQIHSKTKVMTEEQIRFFLYNCKNCLEVIKDGNYTFSVRYNEKDEAQLMIWFFSNHMTIFTSWNRWNDFDDYNEIYYFQDCKWAEQTITCNLSEFTDFVLRCGLEQAENKLSICLSNN